MTELGSFISGLFTKLANVTRIESETGKKTTAAKKEIERQIKESQKIDPVTGKGVTKSGSED